MKKNWNQKLVGLSCLALSLAALAPAAYSQEQTAAKRVAALKATLEASKIVLRQYEWIQTTVVRVNGDEKSRKQERCYYGADGKLQKVLLSQSAPPPRQRGPLRRRIAQRKQEEMTEYMQSAVKLVKSYMPLSPAKIQLVKDLGGVSVEVLDPGKRARLNLRGYEKSGDKLSVEVDLSNNHPLSAEIATYMDEPSEIVTLNARMGRLNDGTTYPSEITLNAPEKNLTVTVENSGYKKSQ